MNKFIENRKILYVDDEDNLLSSFKSLMHSQKIETYILNNSLLIEDFLQTNGPFAVVLSDQRMPGLDGVGTLQKVKAISPDTIRIMITGYSDLESTKNAVNIGGILHYVTKPWNDNELRNLVNDSVSLYNMSIERKYLLEELKNKNEKLELLLQGTVSGVAKILSDVIAAIGSEIASQNVKIKELGEEFLKVLPNLSEEEKWEISRSLELFNLGIVLLPSMVQTKIGREGLKVVNEIPIAQNHNILAANLLSEIPMFENVAKIIRLQRKNFNGSGVPVNEIIKGKEIPVGARILKILTDLYIKSTNNFTANVLLEQMAKVENVYDSELINSFLKGYNPRALNKEEVQLPIEKLKVGMILSEDLKTQSGQILLRKDSAITETVTKLLRYWEKTDSVKSPVLVRLNG